MGITRAPRSKAPSLTASAIVFAVPSAATAASTPNPACVILVAAVLRSPAARTAGTPAISGAIFPVKAAT